MRIERPNSHRNRLPVLPCGCVVFGGGVLVILIIAALIVWPILPNIGLSVVGFEQQGHTEDLFSAVPLAPLPVVVNPDPTPQSVVVDMGHYGRQSLDTSTYNYTINTGSSETGAPIAIAQFDEATLQTMCQQRTPLCGTGHDQVRNARIDLKPGGAIIHAEVFIPQVGIWQALGAVLKLQPESNQFRMVGVDMNGTLYDTPPSNLSSVIADIENTGNAILTQLTLEASGNRYQLSEVQIDESVLTVILR